MNDAAQPPSNNIDGLHGLCEILLRLHLLRGLLWCGSCDTAWVPLLLPPGSLYYVCANQHCPHTAVPAQILEQRVWSRFVRPHEAITQQVSREHRTDMLCGSLRRVVIGNGMRELRLEWFD